MKSVIVLSSLIVLSHLPWTQPSFAGTLAGVTLPDHQMFEIQTSTVSSKNSKATHPVALILNGLGLRTATL